VTGADGETSDANRVAAVTLDERSVTRRNRDIERERQAAIADLLDSNSFTPADPGVAPGPYALHLRLAEKRLDIEIHVQGGAYQTTAAVPLAAFRRIIKDYFRVCESYYEAIRSASPSQIEAIDMGRRGLHNEGSELLQDRLARTAEVDFDTARRLFTLLCVLQARG